MKSRTTAVICSIIAFILIGQTCIAQVPTGQSFQRNRNQDSQKTYLQYLVYLPAGYYADGERQWPLIVFLHYTGAEGMDIDLVKRAALPQQLETGANLPFVVVSPQALLKQLWKPELIITFIDEVCEEFRIDRDRIYLTGPSAGGSATWATAIEYPGIFAAIAPVCGRSSPISYDEDAQRISHLAIWVFHGALDRINKKEAATEMVAALKREGANVKLTLYQDLGHECWDRVYSDPELYQWFLKQRRRSQ